MRTLLKGAVKGKMKKIKSYDEYSEILSDFKSANGMCNTNKIRTREELTILIEAGKLFYEEICGGLWYFVDEGYYYYANFYTPAYTPIHMQKQDMDVIVDLVGNSVRYSNLWEQELIDSGFEKRDRWLQYSCQLDDIINDVISQNTIASQFWACRGFYWRKATRGDYPEFRQLLVEVLGKDRYSTTAMTEQDLDAMERDGTCDVICDDTGKIQAVCLYRRYNQSAHSCGLATYYKKTGLGAFVLYQSLMSMYQTGCKKYIGWIRDNNLESLQLHDHIMKPTGKFYRQFLFRADKTIDLS